MVPYSKCVSIPQAMVSGDIQYIKYFRIGLLTRTFYDHVLTGAFYAGNFREWSQSSRVISSSQQPHSQAIHSTLWMTMFQPHENSNGWNMLPSGKHTKNYGTSPFLIGKSTINGQCSIAIYVSVPEGKTTNQEPTEQHRSMLSTATSKHPKLLLGISSPEHCFGFTTSTAYTVLVQPCWPSCGLF